MLKEFASRIGRNIRGVDLAARYGGEEFVVMMPETSSDLAATIGGRLKDEIASNPFDIGDAGEPINVTVSIGVATSRDGQTPNQLIEEADKALYEAKFSGRNRVVVAAG